MKKSFLIFSILIALCSSSPLFAKTSAGKKNEEYKLGELLEQKIKIGGKKVSCSLVLYGITEYDENGNEVYQNDFSLGGQEIWIEYYPNGKIKYRKSVISSSTTEEWNELDEYGNVIHSLMISDTFGKNEFFMEYDAKGNKIYEQISGGMYKGNTYKYWYEYDTEGKLIHYKVSNDFERWYEYDEKGREIRTYDSKGKESLTEYDKNGNKIYYKNEDNYEEWYEYDKKGNQIYRKNSSGLEEWYDYDSKGNKIHEKWSNYDFEYWSEYDSKGNEIYRKYSSGGKEFYYEYEFYSNGKIKSKNEYLIIIKSKN